MSYRVGDFIGGQWILAGVVDAKPWPYARLVSIDGDHHSRVSVHSLDKFDCNWPIPNDFEATRP